MLHVAFLIHERTLGVVKKSPGQCQEKNQAPSKFNVALTVKCRMPHDLLEHLNFPGLKNEQGNFQGLVGMHFATRQHNTQQVLASCTLHGAIHPSMLVLATGVFCRLLAPTHLKRQQHRVLANECSSIGLWFRCKHRPRLGSPCLLLVELAHEAIQLRNEWHFVHVGSYVRPPFLLDAS